MHNGQRERGCARRGEKGIVDGEGMNWEVGGFIVGRKPKELHFVKETERYTVINGICVFGLKLMIKRDD